MCRQCGIRPSKIHYTEIVNNNMEQMDLCIECAEEKGIDVFKASGGGLGNLVAGLVDTLAPEESEKVGRVQCPKCDYKYSDFKKMGRMGCPDCYKAFHTQLLPLLRQLHGGVRHEGKSPRKLGPRAVIRRELIELKEQLSKAVRDEDYELAAQIRDRIRDLEVKVDKK